MRRPRAPLFLAKSGYRRRRLHDAARLVPVFGVFLILLPILWSPAETEARDTASDGIYLLVVWAGLIAIAALLAPALAQTATPEMDHTPEDRP
ncbi:MAG: hypothetical protein ACRC14_16645 [Paracoccaceae bacterium]